jgi:hypothetical protein
MLTGSISNLPRKVRHLFARENLWEFWLGIIILLSAFSFLLTYRFSLPYIDHPDEPSPYYKALQYRGLYDLPGWEGYPPAYIGLNMATQIFTEGLGLPRKIGVTIPVLRAFAAICSVLTLLLVALTARLIAGDLAGLTTAVIWGISQSTVGDGAFATPDPPAVLCTTLALWFAANSVLIEKRRHWAVWSVYAGISAALFKYTHGIAIIPGGIAALLVFAQNRSTGLKYLLVQGIVVIVIVGWLVWVMEWRKLLRIPAQSKRRRLRTLHT